MRARAFGPLALLVVALPLVVGFGEKPGDQQGDQQDGDAPTEQDSGPAADGSVFEKHVPYAEVDGETLLLDAIAGPTPPEGTRPGIIIVHGGGWRHGDLGDYRPIARSLAARGWATFTIEYRLDEDPAHPAEVEDVERSIAWVRDHAADYDVDPDQIGLLGSSSGGNLAVLAADADHDVEGGPVAVVASLSGLYDLPGILDQPGVAEDVEEKIEDYMGCGVDECRELWEDASPITHVDPSDPPMFLAGATDEDIPEQQAVEMGQVLDEAGVPNQVEVLDLQGHGRALDAEVSDNMVAFMSEQFDVPVPPEAPPDTSGGDRGGGGGAAPAGESAQARPSTDPSSSDAALVVGVVVAILALTGVAVLLGLRTRRRAEPVA